MLIAEQGYDALHAIGIDGASYYNICTRLSDREVACSIAVIPCVFVVAAEQALAVYTDHHIQESLRVSKRSQVLSVDKRA